MSEATGTADILARRRLAAADLGFFTSSASNFHPKPYNPSASSSSPVPHPPNTRTHLANPAPPPDPTPSDPSAVFIHPPFTSFPDAHHYPGGLTYQVMAANQEWFLDPNDFVFPGSTNPNAITYPSQLEPPRGWCPTKKKDLKERGSGNWPEGEEPKLRCTFCRRFYSGVNAKSMWRRHVFEKHKIAMANRRDTVDRTRKGVSKENKSAQGKENQTSARGMRKEVVPSSPQPTAKPKFRSLRPAAEAAAAASSFHDRASSYDDSMDEDAPPVPSAPRIPQEEFPAYRPLGPPLSRGSSQTSATPPPDSPEQDADAFESQIIIRPSPVDDDLDLDDAPPTPTRHTIPSSPYDPKATPSFRHSPARLPSDQPWRFPSPNHPLHCMTEISLSQVTVAPPSPTAIGSHAIDASPVIIAPRKDRSSVFNTPTLAREHGTLSRPTPRHLFPLSGETPASMTDRFKKSFRPTEESPLRYSNFTPRHSKFSDSLDSSSDPFSFDSPLRLNGMASTPTTSPESDSPVMRTSRLMEPLLGPNGERQPSLLAPFSLKRELERDDDDEKDDDDDDDSDSDTLGYQYSGRLHLASPVSRVRLTQSRSYSNSLKGSPTTSRESSSSNDSHLHLRKRRRTLAD